MVIWIVSEKTTLFNKALPQSSIVHWLEEERASYFCEGRLFRSPEVEEGGSNLWLDLTQCREKDNGDWREVRGKVRIRVFGEEMDLQTGDFVRLKTSLRLPHDFQNRGSFKSTLYFRTEGLDAHGSVSDSGWIVKLPGRSLNGFSGWAQKVRQNLRMGIMQGAPDAKGAFLLSLLIGDRKSLGAAWEEAFRKSGVSHILSISGLHVTMVSLIFLFLFRLLSTLPFFSRSVFVFRFYPLAVIVPVWMYVALAAFPVSALRAAIMSSLFLVGLSIWRRLDLLSALAMAAFLILCLSPLSLFGASFQLSFMAVAFLVLFFPHWKKVPLGAWHLVGDSLAISIITLSGVAPLLLYHFHEVSFVGIVANVVVVPLVNFFVMPLGLVGWLLSGLAGLSLPLFWQGVGWFSGITLKTVDWFAAHSEWGIFHGAISFWQLVFYYAALFLFLVRKSFLATKWKLAVSGALMALVLWGGKMPVDGKLTITFVDVGQGDCAVIQLPNGKVWVVDGGGIKGSDWDIGRYVVAPYLWEEGIHKVEYLFLSHPHHDHYKGLGYLAEHFEPKILFMTGDNAPDAEELEWQDFLKRVEKGKVIIQKMNRKTPAIEEAGVRLEFLAPLETGTISHFDTNDNSAVMRLQYKDVSFFLPGDLMEAGEMLLMEKKPNLKSTVLKLGHHGSNTSTKEIFLNAVDPKYAIISVGAYNTYGMPSQEVMDRLQQKEVKIFRTDTQGAITFTTNGQQIDVKTFAP